MILDRIVAQTKVDLIQRKATTPAEALREGLEHTPAPLDMAAALRAPGVSVIAEIKRASPSRGVMNDVLEPAEQAALYADAGADAISVLTEPHHFRGSLADLAAARQGLHDAGAARPILRKDFIVDAYQLLEARRHGADAVLLIVAALDDLTLEHLLDEALTLGLTPLIEVHDEQELGRALPFAPPLVGINNRNLKDFTVDLGVTRRLRPLIPQSCVVVSESGIREPAHMRELRALGVDAALIGEALVTATDPRQRLRELKEAGG
jgi:indole-3-glycerol phosphate synthase